MLLKTLINNLNESKGSKQKDFEVGDVLLVGKFKNRKAIVKGFGRDDNNQPFVKTTKGEFKLYKFRIAKLMPKK